VKVTDKNFARGLEYLMENQSVFGSWPMENIQIKKPLSIPPTAWALTALASSFESLMINIISPESDQVFTIEDEKYVHTIKTEVYNSGSSKISYTEFFVDEKSIGKVKSEPFSLEWKPQELSGGKHEIMVVIKSKDGNEASDIKSIAVDKSIKVTFISPEKDKVPELETKIKIEIKNESGSPIKKVEYFLGEELLGEKTEEPYEMDWNTADVKNGTHSLTAKVYNEEGDITTEEQIISISRKLEITLNTPKKGEVIEDIVHISSTITNESGSPVEKVEYYLEDDLIGSSDDEPDYKYKWEVEDIKNGDYMIKAIVYNELEESSTYSHEVSVAHSLKIKLRNINEGDTVTGNIEFWSDVISKSDSPIKEVSYYIDGRAIGSTDDASPKITNDVIEKLKGEKFSSEQLKALKTLIDKDLTKAELKEELTELKYIIKVKIDDNSSDEDKFEEKEKEFTEEEIEKILSLSENTTPYHISWDSTEYASGTYILKTVVENENGDKAHQEKEIILEHPISYSLYTTVVTDKKVYSITLNEKDFILEENGKKQEIDEFKKGSEITSTSYCIIMDTGSHLI